MLKKLIFTAVFSLFTSLAMANEAPRVVLNTNLGEIELELNAAQAPITVANFLKYVEEKRYDGTVFHRVIDGFMIQGGGFDKHMQKKSTFAPIKNEAQNGLLNERGTIAMARTANVDSATSQWFINLAHNEFLDHGVRDFGYAVFGKVTRGMEVVDKIAKLRTYRYGQHENMPVDRVIVEQARLLP